MYAEEFEVIDRLRDGLVNEDTGVFSLVPSEVHNQLLCFAKFEGEVVQATLSDF